MMTVTAVPATARLAAALRSHLRPDFTADVSAGGNRGTSSRGLALLPADLLHHQPPSFESYDVPGYVPSPNSTRGAALTSTTSSASAAAVVAAAPQPSHGSTPSSIQSSKTPRPSTAAASNAAADETRQESMESAPEFQSFVPAITPVQPPSLLPMQPSSAHPLPSKNQSLLASSAPAPSLAPAVAASFDDNPALRLGQEDDPSVIKFAPPRARPSCPPNSFSFPPGPYLKTCVLGIQRTN